MRQVPKVVSVVSAFQPSTSSTQFPVKSAGTFCGTKLWTSFPTALALPSCGAQPPAAQQIEPHTVSVLTPPALSQGAGA